MADPAEFEIDTARDTAQQAVTAALHGDRDTAGDIVAAHPHPLAVALVLVDLVAHVHHRWATALGMSTEERNDGWAELLTDVEEWRTTRD